MIKVAPYWLFFLYKGDHLRRVVDFGLPGGEGGPGSSSLGAGGPGSGGLGIGGLESSGLGAGDLVASGLGAGGV